MCVLGWVYHHPSKAIQGTPVNVFHLYNVTADVWTKYTTSKTYTYSNNLMIALVPQYEDCSVTNNFLISSVANEGQQMTSITPGSVLV